MASLDAPAAWSLDLDAFSSPVPLTQHKLSAPLKPGVYVVAAGGCVPHIGTSSKLRGRIYTLATLGNHRGSAEVLCAAYCTGVEPTVRWLETESVADARALEKQMKALGEPPQPRGEFAGCVNGAALKKELVEAAGPSTPEAGYIEAIFDIGEQLRRLFASRFNDVWAVVGKPPGPWAA